MKQRNKPLAAAAAKKQQRAPARNPFEIKKAKSRFATVGRRLKGATKNVVKAREQAIEKRDKTLLVEYKQLRKSNSFVDRRFGENDAKLTEDDKAFARLRTQRLKAKRTPLGGGKKVKFALGGEDGEAGLTHMGKSLSDMDNLDEAPDMDDVDDDIMEEVMKDYNFGGGGDDATAKGPDGKPKTKNQVMQEIIARSKVFKAERQKQKEDDLEAMQQLDDVYRALLKSQALAAFVKPKGYTKDNKVKATTKDDVDYDVAARELAFEGKGRAADRTLTAEEEAEKKRVALEQLERERLRRMRGGVNDDELDTGPAALGGPKGGYAARRAKIKAKQAGQVDSDEGEEGEQDDEGEEGEEDDEDDEEMGGNDDEGLQKRRMTRAAGSHPLQSALREKAAELAAKYGLGKVRNPMLEEGEDEESDGEGEDGDDEGEEGEDEDGEGEQSGSEEGDGEGESSDGMEEREEAEEGPAAGAGKKFAHGSPAEADEDAGEDEDDVYEQELKALQDPRLAGARRPTETAAAGKDSGPSSAAPGAGAELSGPLDLPYTIPVPETYQAFAALVAGRPPEQLVLVVDRIRAFNAAALASDSKRKLQVLYGILVQHFAALAGEVPIPVAHLDAMVPMLLLATSEVPYYAATVARARLVRIHDRLSAALSGNAVASLQASNKPPAKAGPQQQQPGASESAWPGARALLQLKLFSMLFPTSDRRHPVLTPSLLLTCRALSQCTAADIGEAVRGLVLAGLALHMTAPASRHCPEPLTFLAHLLLSYCGAVAGASADGDVIRRVVPGLLAPVAKGKALAKVAPTQVGLLQALTLPAGPTAPGNGADTAPMDDGFKLGLLHVALHAAARASDAAASSRDSYPEATQQLRSAVATLGTCLHLPPQLEQQRSDLQAAMERIATEAVAQRRPLVRLGGMRSVPAREFNPRFEEGFAKGRDYDPDRERAEERKLKKELAKQRRGAMRELRKDAVYMSEVRDRERAQVDTERMDSQRKFYSELQQQQADLNSGGQGGMNPHLKKRRKKK